MEDFHGNVINYTSLVTSNVRTFWFPVLTWMASMLNCPTLDWVWQFQTINYWYPLRIAIMKWGKNYAYYLIHFLFSCANMTAWWCSGRFLALVPVALRSSCFECGNWEGMREERKVRNRKWQKFLKIRPWKLPGSSISSLAINQATSEWRCEGPDNYIDILLY